jgi:DNA-binding NtrC family response regulator
VDVRLIAATNKDLKDQVVRKNFREDLFYRLNVIRVEVPPLRERREDIPELARHFIRKYARKMAKQVRGIDDAALAALERYDWPGNVRELENEMERALLLCDSQQIGVHDLSVSDVSAAPAPGDQPRLDQLEKASILKVLRDTGGNRSRASRILGINRKTLYLKLKKYGISGSSD